MTLRLSEYIWREFWFKKGEGSNFRGRILSCLFEDCFLALNIEKGGTFIVYLNDIKDEKN
jgi:hypothetical protein